MCKRVAKADTASVHQASRAEVALHVLDGDTAIDRPIVDYAMPGMNGVETVRQARQRRPGLKALMISGHMTVAQDAGALAILQ